MRSHWLRIVSVGRIAVQRVPPSEWCYPVGWHKMLTQYQPLAPPPLTGSHIVGSARTTPPKSSMSITKNKTRRRYLASVFVM
jgi:hypothetical protein